MSQRELLDGLNFWTELKGIALVVGPAGVGRSIRLRRLFATRPSLASGAV